MRMMIGTGYQGNKTFIFGAADDDHENLGQEIPQEVLGPL